MPDILALVKQAPLLYSTLRICFLLQHRTRELWLCICGCAGCLSYLHAARQRHDPCPTPCLCPVQVCTCIGLGLALVSLPSFSVSPEIPSEPALQDHVVPGVY